MALVLLWKPAGPGSQEFIRDFKRGLGLAKDSNKGIGHSGTLDPFAEGLLICALGEGTKLLAPLTGLSKTYQVRMLLGATSNTFDRTSDAHFGAELKLDRDDFETKLKLFLNAQRGSHEQVPPQFSAVHVDGKRAYEWAREGIEKPLPARAIEIFQAQHEGLTRVEHSGKSLWAWDFEVKVSSGTYIRAFARDWAVTLTGGPGMLSSLVRTAIGPFEADPELRAAGHRWLTAAESLRPLFDLRTIDAPQVERLMKSGFLSPQERSDTFLQRALLCAPDGRIVAYTEAPHGKLGRVFLSDPLAPEARATPLRNS